MADHKGETDEEIALRHASTLLPFRHVTGVQEPHPAQAAIRSLVARLREAEQYKSMGLQFAEQAARLERELVTEKQRGDEYRDRNVEASKRIDTLESELAEERREVREIVRDYEHNDHGCSTRTTVRDIIARLDAREREAAQSVMRVKE